MSIPDPYVEIDSPPITPGEVKSTLFHIKDGDYNEQEVCALFELVDGTYCSLATAELS